MPEARPARRRDSVQAHYTSSDPIVRFMASRLRVGESDVVWEPCGGGGHLVDAVLRHGPLRVLVNEIEAGALAVLREKYRGDPRIVIADKDALLTRPGAFVGPVTRVIANPPYGAWQDSSRRKRLKKRFPGLYVKDSYAVFLYHAAREVQRGGRLVFILSDTFLWLNRHEFLRRFLLGSFTIEEIALFPSRFFPNINFGFSGMGIISLIKERPEPGHKIRVLRGLDSPDCLGRLAEADGDRGSFEELCQSQVAAREKSALFIPRSGAALGARTAKTLGDCCEIKTGFYSGNDRRWLRRASDAVKRSKSYQDVDPALVYQATDGKPPPLSGIDQEEHFIPIVRGGMKRFVKRTEWYVDWSEPAVASYRRKGRDNPARFQNSPYYFREGLGVPMVASSRLSAALLEGRLFDQAIVGVFPHRPDLLRFILGFLNTELATRLIRAINPTANNSASYLKRIPFVFPDEAEIDAADLLVSEAIEEARARGEISDRRRLALSEFYAELWS